MRGIELYALKIGSAALLTIGCLVAPAPILHADPLSSAEVEFLSDVRHALAGDPDLAKNDAELLAAGHRACEYRAAGHEDIDLPDVSGAVAAWALTDLCPALGDF
jgi:hypothetical protein